MAFATRSLALLLGACALGCAPPRTAADPEPPVATGSGHRLAEGALPPAAGVLPQPAPSVPAQPATPLAVEHGKATYYSDGLAGRKTASGQPYIPANLTAAHKKLPFGTRVRVIRTDTGHQVIVVINDRGPFAGAERIIDVSGAAARQLDMMRAGVVPVRVEVLEYGTGRR